MKVLIFAHNFPPAIDGGAKLLGLIALRERKRGNKVRVLSSDAYSSDDYLDWKAKRLKAKQARWRGMLVFRAKTWRWPKQLVRRITGPIFLWLPIFSFCRWRPQKIIAGVFPTTIPVYALILARICRARLILVPCFHRNDRTFHRPWLIFALKKASRIIALTNLEKNFYIKKFKINKHKITIFHPQIDRRLLLKKRAKFTDPPLILFLGSLAAHKRVEVLIKSFNLLITHYPSPITHHPLLTIAGPKTLYWPQIKKKLASLPSRTRKRIKVLGQVPEKEKVALLDRAWVLVNPSIHESLGLVFLEAWARKKPVIAADTPLSREIIADNKNGLLFKKDNAKDLARKISRLFRDKKLAAQMGKEGNKMLK